MSVLTRILMVSALAFTACGNKSEAVKAKDDANAPPPLAPIATPVVGVDAIRRMNFTWEAGKLPYDKAVAAYKAGKAGAKNVPRDWAAIRANTEAAVAKDPHHLDAHRLLATALVKSGEPAAAVEHFATALAGDYVKYAPSIAKDDELKEFLTTPHGASVNDVSAKIKAEYDKRIASGVWVVARRSAFKWPNAFGTEYATSRGELYAFDRETKRYLRLSHTEHQVTGFVRSASGHEVLLLGFDKIDRKPAAKGDEAPPPLLANAWIEVLDGSSWERIGKRASLGGGREVAVGYGPGEQILVATAPASGRWGVGAQALSSLDRTTGKLTKVTAAPPVPRIVFSLEDGRQVRSVEGIAATWTGEPPTAPSLAAGGATITVPESGAAAQSTIALSPDQASLAFATAIDPCAKDVAPSLYVAAAKTGAIKHVLTSKSRFATRWIDATTLAYEDGDGAIRVWDAAKGAQVLRLENKPGIALDVLSLAAGPLCKQQPPAADATGSGAAEEPPLPPEVP